MIGKAIRHLRGAATQREHAERIGMSVQHLCDIEGDRRDPRFGTVQRLAKAHGMSVSELVALAEQLEANPQ